MGDTALRNEIDRATRFGRALVLAFIAIDTRPQLRHDTRHAQILEAVAEIRSQLWSYDPVARYAAIEYVCGLPDTDGPLAHERFKPIHAALAAAHISLRIGYSEYQAGDTLERITLRGQAALLAVRTLRLGPSFSTTAVTDNPSRSAHWVAEGGAT